MLYALSGVIVHSGSDNAGHYWSYARSEQEAPEGGAGQDWWCLNDASVTRVSKEAFESVVFGGGRSSTSAYVLLYRRTV